MLHATRKRWQWAAGAVALIVSFSVVPACQPNGRHVAPPQSQPVPQQRSLSSDAVVVASFNFPESDVLAEIYAGALERAGVPVRRELDLGPRELVQPALEQGLVDVVPEYAGTALANVDPGSTADVTDVAAVTKGLAAALAPWHIEVLRTAQADNENAIAVSRATADRLGLRTISDLAAHAGELSLAGPPECPKRPYCLIGWQQRYGLHFRSFVPYETTTQRATALEQGVADLAVLFSTDAVVADRDLVLLDDDRHLQPADNVVPLVSSRAKTAFGARIVDALDHVSAALTTSQLRFLNRQVVIAGHSARAEAKAWLDQEH